MIVRNRGAASVYLSDAADVTIATGFQLDAGESFEKEMGNGDALWAISAATQSNSLHVFTDDRD